ncbi:aromatic amino acid transport family protein [Peribacillus sp. YIM B13472]|uniref:aromatic amino acid transport family protein n=1 Tax=Peribacillus sp. YIM B13472 TaxID=3366297 RepID=UPI00366F796C
MVFIEVFLVVKVCVLLCTTYATFILNNFPIIISTFGHHINVTHIIKLYSKNNIIGVNQEFFIITANWSGKLIYTFYPYQSIVCIETVFIRIFPKIGFSFK